MCKTLTMVPINLLFPQKIFRINSSGLTLLASHYSSTVGYGVVDLTLGVVYLSIQAKIAGHQLRHAA